MIGWTVVVFNLWRGGNPWSVAHYSFINAFFFVYPLISETNQDDRNRINFPVLYLTSYLHRSGAENR